MTSDIKHMTSDIKHMTLSQPRLSIIVPIYNVAPYLRKCVDSLLAQDYDDYEIILVDDGSPDSCPQVCDEYVEKAKSGKLRAKSGADVPQTSDIQHQTSGVISVIHRENGGLSAARNSGIEVAQGKYVMFVDSDDYIEPNVLGALMAQIERDNLDVLRFNYQNVNERYEVFLPFKDAKRDVDYSGEIVDGETFLNERLGPGCYAWQFLLRRDLIYSGHPLDTQHNTSDIAQRVLFTPGIYFEDTDWTPRMLLKAQRVASTDRIVYNYLWRQGSITLPDNPTKKKKVLEDKISLLRGFQQQSKLVRNPIWYTWMTSFNTMTILNMLSVIPSSERNIYIQELKSLGVFPLYTKKEKGLKRRKIQIANVSPTLYCALMKLRNK